MSDLKNITLDSVANGAAPDRFALELAKVAENIIDPNTSETAARSITLKFTITPAEDRGSAVVKLSSSCSLAPHKAEASTMFLGKKEGKLVVVGFDPGQGHLFEDEVDPDVRPIESGRAGVAQG